MKISEVRALIQLRKPEPDRVERTLSRCVTIEDLQHAAPLAQERPRLRGGRRGR